MSYEEDSVVKSNGKVVDDTKYFMRIVARVTPGGKMKPEVIRRNKRKILTIKVGDHVKMKIYVCLR